MSFSAGSENRHCQSPTNGRCRRAPVAVADAAGDLVVLRAGLPQIRRRSLMLRRSETETFPDGQQSCSRTHRASTYGPLMTSGFVSRQLGRSNPTIILGTYAYLFQRADHAHAARAAPERGTR
jgi:hypothetical protein